MYTTLQAMSIMTINNKLSTMPGSPKKPIHMPMLHSSNKDVTITKGRQHETHNPCNVSTTTKIRRSHCRRWLIVGLLWCDWRSSKRTRREFVPLYDLLFLLCLEESALYDGLGVARSRVTMPLPSSISSTSGSCASMISLKSSSMSSPAGFMMSLVCCPPSPSPHEPESRGTVTRTGEVWIACTSGMPSSGTPSASVLLSSLPP
mmetsp:Transcript_28723/g.86877  ORF Transcript_28723/g.86877 Transcript_28723/m.86877 type:complete len:204 (-) Transcript_28723:97-708(-)